MQYRSSALKSTAACLATILTIVTLLGASMPGCADDPKGDQDEILTALTLAPGNTNRWNSPSVVAFDPGQPHLYLALQGTNVTSATTFECAYFPNGLIGATQIPWRVNSPVGATSPTGQPLQSDDFEGALLDLTPSITPTGGTPTPPLGSTKKGTNGPIGSGVIVIQGKGPVSGTLAVIGEARLRVWITPQ